MQITHHVIDSQVATKTSDPINVNNARRINIFFERDDHSQGSSVCTVNVAASDGTDLSDYVVYGKLITNAANTNVQDVTRVASVTISSDTTVMYAIDPMDVFDFLTVKMTRVTDGTNDAWVVVDYGEQNAK